MGAFGLGGGVLLEEGRKPKPVFPCSLPCGLNGFGLPLFPSLPIGSGLSVLLPMRQQFPVFLLAHLEGANDQQELN